MNPAEILMAVYAEEGNMARQMDNVRIAVATLLITGLGASSVYILSLPPGNPPSAFLAAVAVAVFSGVMTWVIWLYHRFYLRCRKISRRMRRRALEVSQNPDFELTYEWLRDEIAKGMQKGQSEAKERGFALILTVTIVAMTVPLVLLVVTGYKYFLWTAC